jgi:hypothetical protein
MPAYKAAHVSGPLHETVVSTTLSQYTPLFSCMVWDLVFRLVSGASYSEEVPAGWFVLLGAYRKNLVREYCLLISAAWTNSG